MAWSIVGVGTVAETTTTSLTLTEPAGVVAGDLLVMCIAGRGYTSGSTWCGTPTGWISVQRTGQANTSTNTSALANAAMFYCTRGASAPSYAVTLSGTASVARGLVVAYRGQLQTASLDVSGTVSTATNTTSVNVAGITTTTANDLMVSMVAGGQEAAWSAFKSANAPSTASGATNTSSIPSAGGWTERVDSITTSGADTSIAVFDAEKVAIGATGNYTATASLGAGHVVINAAFKPARSTLIAWNGADASSAYLTLTNSDQTVASGSNITAGIRSTKKNLNGTAGKYYVEFELAAGGGSTTSFYGIMSASAALTGTGAGGFHLFGTGNIYVNGVSQGISVGVLNPGHVAAIAWDAGAELAWFRNGSGAAGWNNSGTANPATGVGGISVSFAASVNHAAWFQAEVSGESVNLYTRDADFRLTKPAGFLSWTGELQDAWSALDKGPTITLSASDKTATATNNVSTGTRSTQSHPHGSGGKYYAELVALTSSSAYYGICDVTVDLTSTAHIIVNAQGLVRVNNVQMATGLGTVVAGSVIGIAWDAGARRVWFRIGSGLWNNNAAADPVTGANGIDTSTIPDTQHALLVQTFISAGDGATIRTESVEFTQTGPNGFLSWMGETLELPNVANVTGLSVTASVGPANVAQIYVGLTAGVTVGVVGSGGSLPTGWLAETTPNVTLTVVSGRTVDDGVECFDLQIDATTGTAGSYCAMYYPLGWGVGMTRASRGNTFKAGAYLKKLATSGPGIGGNALQVVEGGSGYTYINDYSNNTTIPTTGAFQASYRELSHSILDPAVAYASGLIHIGINVTAGATSLTFRIAAKLEASMSINASTQSVGVGTAGIGGSQFVFGSLVPENIANFVTEFGTKVSFAKAGRITHIRYWRDPTNAGTARTTRLWLVSSQTQLAATTGANDGSITGWVNGDPLNYDVAAGVEYVVSVNVPTVYSWTDFSFPLVKGDVTALTGMYHPGSAGNYPTNAISYILFIEPVFRAFSDEETVFTTFGAIVNVAGNQVDVFQGSAGAAAITGDAYFAIDVNANDGYWQAPANSWNTANIYNVFGRSSGNYYKPGWRFPNVVIPKDSNILSATLYNSLGSTGGTSTVGNIHGVALDNMAVWNSTTNSPQTVPRTTASTTVTVTAGNTQIDVRTGVQEIVNRAGWARGNALGLVGWPDDVGIDETYVTFTDMQYQLWGASRLRIVWQQPPVSISINAATNLITASVGDETILLPVVINVWGVSVVAGSVGLGVGQSAIALTPPVNGYSTTELGSKIRFSKAGRVTHIRYWRDPLATGMARTTRLWDVNTQTQLTATSGADDGSITGWVTGDPINWNVVAGVDYMASVGNPDYYPYLADPPYPLVNGHVTVLGGAWSGGSGIGAYPATDLTSPPLCLFVDVIFRENSAEETVNTGVSLTAATSLLTTTVGNESVTIPVSVNATTNLISTTTGTVTLPRLVPVTTNLITVSLGDEVVRLPKIVNAATNLITVSDNVVTVTTRTDVSTNLTGQSVSAYVGLEGAGSTPYPDAWDWTTAMPIGMNLTNNDMTVGG